MLSLLSSYFLFPSPPLSLRNLESGGHRPRVGDGALEVNHFRSRQMKVASIFQSLNKMVPGSQSRPHQHLRGVPHRKRCCPIDATAYLFLGVQKILYVRFNNRQLI
jgi:hypothetical protein